MFKTILYPTDFSDVSKKALKYFDHLRDSGAENAAKTIDEVSDTHEVDLIEGL